MDVSGVFKNMRLLIHSADPHWTREWSDIATAAGAQIIVGRKHVKEADCVVCEREPGKERHWMVEARHVVGIEWVIQSLVNQRVVRPANYAI